MPPQRGTPQLNLPRVPYLANTPRVMSHRHIPALIRAASP